MAASATGYDLRALAEERGLKVYDTALPLAWYEDVHKRTDFWPQNHGFVWCYDPPSTTWGRPEPLTDAAAILLAFYDVMLKNNTSWNRG